MADDEPSVMVDLIAGWASGAVAVMCVQPIDTWLTRHQALATGLPKTSGLWRGSLPMIWSVPLQNALLMGGYGVGQKFFTGEDGSARQTVAIFVGGCSGGILQSFLMSPVELIKVTQQVSSKSLSTASIALTMNWSSGLNATILRDGIPHGVWFVAYDITKREWNRQFVESSKYSAPLVAGAVAATVAWGVGYPADLIKTRIQASTAQSPTIMGTTREIIQTSGFSGLYKGFGLKLVRSIPASMIGFSVYELVKDAITIY